MNNEKKAIQEHVIKTVKEALKREYGELIEVNEPVLKENAFCVNGKWVKMQIKPLVQSTEDKILPNGKIIPAFNIDEAHEVYAKAQRYKENRIIHFLKRKMEKKKIEEE